MGKGSYVLYESAVGYALFEVEEGEEIGALLPDVQAASFDLQKFSKMVKFKSFVPFASSESALQNINDVSEGNVNDDLKTFLDMNLSELKSKGITLGVADPKLATSIQTATGLVCRVDDTIREYVRGIRAHFPKLVKIVSGGVTDRAQLGLGHSYSRCKVKFNVNRSDNMIIQAIALLDQLDKDLNTFAMRVKEWYSWHFPEMSVLVKDNYLYSRVAQVIQSRTKFLKDEAEGRKKLTEILMDDDVVDKVVAAMRTSMGMDVSEIDMLNIKTFAARVVSLSKYRKGLQDYLTERMTAVAPNLQALIGDVVGARLISHAGSLTNLAKAPASTVQILGAEKALFRALKTRGNTPKYGLIYHSTFIGRAGTKNKGRISRYLANKCSIASRIDAFSDQATAKYGEMLRDQVEERLKFYDTGETPRKNMDCMSAVARELSADADSTSTPSSKKRKATAWDGDDDSDAAPSSKKKKKSKKEKKEKKEKKKKKKSM